MDVATLVVRAGYEGQELTRGLRQSASDIERFGRQTTAQLANIKPPRFDPITPKVDVSSAVAALKTLDVAVREVSRDASGVRMFTTAARDVETATNVFRKLGVDARVVAEQFNAASAAAARIPQAIVRPAQQAAAAFDAISTKTRGASQSFALINRLASSRHSVAGRVARRSPLVSGSSHWRVVVRPRKAGCVRRCARSRPSRPCLARRVSS